MDLHEGIIEITGIRNSGSGADQSGTLTGRFVRYPGSQQLSIWLPGNGWEYDGNVRILNLKTQTILEEKPVSDLLNGSVLMTWDTLTWPTGEYLLEIAHPKGGTHELYIKKWEEGELYPKDELVEMPVTTAQSLLRVEPVQTEQNSHDNIWQVYKDGSGQDIPNIDQTLRESMNLNIQNIFKKLLTNTGPKLEYEGNFRGGNVIYLEGDLRLTFWHEMGGGDCKMYIDVPDASTWEQRTNTPLTRRAEILLFVANTVRLEKAPSWRYEIGEREIAFY